MRVPGSCPFRLDAARSIVGFAVIAVLLHGCSLFAADAFPPFLPYVSGELDLSGQIPSAIRRVRMHATISPDGGRFFAIIVEPDGSGTAALVLLDEGLTGVIEQEDAPLSFDSRLLTRIDGSLQVGSLIYNPVSGEVRNGPGPIESLQPIAHDATSYWAIRTESDVQITFDRYSDSFVPGGSWATPAEAVTPSESVRAVEMHARSQAIGGPGEYVVFVLTSVGLRRTVLTESDFVAETGFPVDSLTGIGSQLLPVGNFDAVRETPDGILVADGSRLARYDRATGALLDDFELGENGRSEVPYVVAFDPEGEFYLILDAGNRALFRVDPWW